MGLQLLESVAQIPEKSTDEYSQILGIDNYLNNIGDINAFAEDLFDIRPQFLGGSEAMEVADTIAARLERFPETSIEMARQMANFFLHLSPESHIRTIRFAAGYLDDMITLLKRGSEHPEQMQFVLEILHLMQITNGAQLAEFLATRIAPHVNRLHLVSENLEANEVKLLATENEEMTASLQKQMYQVALSVYQQSLGQSELPAQDVINSIILGVVNLAFQGHVPVIDDLDDASVYEIARREAAIAALAHLQSAPEFVKINDNNSQLMEIAAETGYQLSLPQIDGLMYTADSLMNFSGNLTTLLYQVWMAREKKELNTTITVEQGNVEIYGLTPSETLALFIPTLENLRPLMHTVYRDANSMMTPLDAAHSLFLENTAAAAELLDRIKTNFRSQSANVLTVPTYAPESIDPRTTIVRAVGRIMRETANLLRKEDAIIVDTDNVIMSRAHGLVNLIRLLWPNEEDEATIDKLMSKEYSDIITTLLVNYMLALIKRVRTFKPDDGALSYTKPMEVFAEICRELEEVNFPLVQMVDKVLLEWSIALPNEPITLDEPTYEQISKRIVFLNNPIRVFLIDLVPGLTPQILNNVQRVYSGYLRERRREIKRRQLRVEAIAGAAN